MAKQDDGSGRWKKKFIKVKMAGEKHEKKIEDNKQLEGFEEDEVGPDNFLVIAKLGQGSFGVVYLVEKINVMEDGTKVNTHNQYAMKILNKK